MVPAAPVERAGGEMTEDTSERWDRYQRSDGSDEEAWISSETSVGATVHFFWFQVFIPHVFVDHSEVSVSRTSRQCPYPITVPSGKLL